MDKARWHESVNKHREAEYLDRGRDPASARAPLNIAIMNRQIAELYDLVEAQAAELLHLKKKLKLVE